MAFPVSFSSLPPALLGSLGFDLGSHAALGTDAVSGTRQNWG